MALCWIGSGTSLHHRTIGLRAAQKVFEAAGLDPVAAEMAYRQCVDGGQNEEAAHPSPAMLRAASVWRRAQQVAWAESGPLDSDAMPKQLFASSEIASC